MDDMGQLTAYDRDGYADLIWMSKTSKISIWINGRAKLAKA